MGNFNDIDGTTVFVSTNPIPEPLSPPNVFSKSLERFDPNLYNTSIDSHLYKFLLALAGDAGAGLVAKQVSYARFQSRLNSTHFTDLDKFYTVLGLPRLQAEIYSLNQIDNQPLDPRGQVLTPIQWQEVTLKDSLYRARCLAWMDAISHGGTTRGIAKAAEAALGVECFVFENYKYLDKTYNSAGLQPNFASNSQNRKHFVILPQIPQNQVTQEQQYYLYNLINRLKPAGTFFTINYSSNPRVTVTPSASSSSSEFFYITKFVTGNSNIAWPTVDSTQGFWIEPGVSNPAPTSAFMLSQEYVTTFPINTAIASSYNIGAFNLQQQAFFPNLVNDTVPPVSYLPTFSYSINSTPLSSTASWTNSYNSTDQVLMVNTYYPLNYFSITNTQFNVDSPFRFWASTENAQNTSETLTLDLGSNNQVNVIDFEITQKPITMSFQYSLDGVTWTNTSFASEFDFSNQINFVPGVSNPWIYYQGHFDTFYARYIKITFLRTGVLSDPNTFLPFNWSIDVKNVRISHQVNNLQDILDSTTLQPATVNTKNFLSDSGVDFFGNKFTTSITTFDTSNISLNNNIYWQSQANPSPFAVENIYFDLRDVNGASQVITEVYLDPITIGCSMHFYWSNDDTNSSNWDNKLWTPIPLSYILKKGYVNFPTPLNIKYFKIEFSNLVPIPYNPIEYPETPTIVYNKFPTWVQNYFLSQFPITLNSQNLQYPFSSVALNTVNSGFERPTTILNNSDLKAPPTVNLLLNSIQQAQNNLVISSTRNQVQSRNRTKVGNLIKIVNNTTFKDNLAQFDLSDSLSRFLFNTSTTESNIINTLIATEGNTPTYSSPQNQSVIDLSQEEINKKLPIMHFPFTSRHGYQTLTAPRTSKIAWIVGLRYISFFRRDYGQTYDEPFIVETLADSFNFQQNDFTSNVWNYTVLK